MTVYMCTVILENSQMWGRKQTRDKCSLDLVRKKGSSEIIFFSLWGSLGAELQVRVTQEYTHWGTLKSFL